MKPQLTDTKHTADISLSSVDDLFAIPFFADFFFLYSLFPPYHTDDWESVERLNLLPKLTELRCQGLKVLNRIENDAEKRHHLIARLPKIQRLNGSEILDDERMFAERAFVRYHLAHDDVSRPARFHALQAITGKVDQLAEVDLSPPKTAHVTVVFNERNNMDGQEDSDVMNIMPCESSGRSGNQATVKHMTINLNRSVKEFKQGLR